MVKLIDKSDGEADVHNIAILSEKIGALIREAFAANAMHPASVIGILTYHSVAVSSQTQRAFMHQPTGPQIIIPPPGSFKP